MAFAFSRSLSLPSKCPCQTKGYCLCLPRASFILEGLCLCHRRVFSLICHRTASAFAFQVPLPSKDLCLPKSFSFQGLCLPRVFAFQGPLPSKGLCLPRAFAFQGTSFVSNGICLCLARAVSFGFEGRLPLSWKGLCLRSAFGLKPTLRI